MQILRVRDCKLKMNTSTYGKNQQFRLKSAGIISRLFNLLYNFAARNLIEQRSIFLLHEGCLRNLNANPLVSLSKV